MANPKSCATKKILRMCFIRAKISILFSLSMSIIFLNVPKMIDKTFKPICNFHFYYFPLIIFSKVSFKISSLFFDVSMYVIPYFGHSFFYISLALYQSFACFVKYALDNPYVQLSSVSYFIHWFTISSTV